MKLWKPLLKFNEVIIKILMMFLNKIIVWGLIPIILWFLLYFLKIIFRDSLNVVFYRKSRVSFGLRGVVVECQKHGLLFSEKCICSINNNVKKMKIQYFWSFFVIISLIMISWKNSKSTLKKQFWKFVRRVLYLVHFFQYFLSIVFLHIYINSFQSFHKLVK